MLLSPPDSCLASFFFFLNFILFLAAVGLCCCVQASHCGGFSLRWLLLLRSMGSRLFSCCGARALGSRASVVMAHRLSCSVACGIFTDRGLNPCPLHWEVDSQPLRHQGSPCLAFLIAPPFSVLWRTGWFVRIQTLTEWRQRLLWDWHRSDAATTASRHYGGPEKQYARKKKKTKDRKAEGEGTCSWATVHVHVCLKENRRCKSEGVFLFKNDRDASLSVAK